LNAVVDGNCCLRTIGLNVIEDGFAIGKCQYRPFQKHELTLFLAKRGSAPFREIGLNLFVSNGWSRIVEGLLHFGFEPRVVFHGIMSQIERESALSGGSRQENADRI
jgi:hypothetical protein